MNLFDQYGIKEIADVTIYSIHKKEDGSGDVYYVPALYLDTLKVATTEKSADNTWAQGGLGNSRLVGWDYGKTINLNFEDALCTPASLGLCWGGILSADWKDGQISQRYGINNLQNCGTERISRMEKVFYPRNDMTDATISNLLPRDGSEDILEDQNGDPVYLQRSSVLDGTDVRGFGYVGSHPYKWRAEIETEVKSIAIVPDRFFSVYGKSYPIKRKQTVGINQPSESFKYEIIYMRGYDRYNDEPPRAKIIYHKQAEENIAHEYVCNDDREALKLLDNFDNYPYLKIRVCFDGSIKAYLGTKNVDWDLTRQIEDEHVALDTAWVEIPQINTEQFKGIDLWLRFDSINALSYYLITKYEENIFKIGPKNIINGLNVEVVVRKAILGDDAQRIAAGITRIESSEFFEKNSWYTRQQLVSFFGEAASTEFFNALATVVESTFGQSPVVDISESTILYSINEDDELFLKSVSNRVNKIVGKDYSLVDSVSENSTCVPCCKKANLSRSIWAYVNPKTMTPYDDDYWFHQGEPYYKKSLTLSTKDAPVKAQRIYVEAGVFPGMYKIVGETYIRSRDTGEDERVQLSFPLCKIKSNQTLTLQADGDPTTFNFEVEVAVPENNIPMEITFYEVEKDVKKSCCGSIIEKDGSTRVSAK